MKLTSLRVFGFKTFAEQTGLAFEPGITALVGPNGSGKSNLVDAIRWVLGEQSSKSLRGANREDVIFAGNERRKPLGMAEVAITFANDDGALRIDAREVQITRRAYRAGESEFFINRQSVRLRDVIELLMGTGLGPGSYAIVSQGQIDAILAAKPSERRSLFEETAGINRFLARKNESLRRLEQTEQNGIRTSDLLSELAARAPELETQARRARRYRKASARARDLEILAYLRAGASRREERTRLEADLERHDTERGIAATKAATALADLAALRTELDARERALDDLRGEIAAARAALAEIDARRAAATARRDALERQSSQFTGDRERAEAERLTLGETIARIASELEPQQSALEARRAQQGGAQAALAETRARFEAVFADVRAVEASAATQAASDAERRAQLDALLRDQERLERDARTLHDQARERAARLEASIADCERTRTAHASFEARLDATRAAALAADERVAAAAAALLAAESTYRDVTSELASAEARLHTIEELEANLEGHVPGTRAVLEATARGEFDGIIGVVSNLVRVDERYARALDIAFGASLSNIVTETSEAAERAIAFLRAREAGRATFLPLDTLGSRIGRDAREAPREPGVVGYAHELAKPTEPRYAGIVAFLVGRMLVVETLDVGVKLVRTRGFRDAVVTLDGDEIRGGGAMTGGRYKRERSILSRRAQARTLSDAMPELRERLDRAAAAAGTARSESVAATVARDDARRAQAECASALRDAQSRLERATAETARLSSEIAGLRERSQASAREAASHDERRLALEAPHLDPTAALAERTRLESALAFARDEIASAQEAERGLAAEIATAREGVASLVARRDAASARLGLLDADGARAAAARETLVGDLAALAAEIAAAHARVAEMRTQIDVHDVRLETLRVERDTVRGRARDLELAATDAQSAEREASSAGDGGRLRLAEIDAELGMLTAQFAQNPATADECADVEARYTNEPGDVTPELARLRDELARMQNVNLNAEADIEELAERERFLREQLEDLTRARETLLASIAEIEASSQAQFDETFALVRTAFEDVYARLFPGGQAKMWQTETEKAAETGIELAVQPPGKKMMPLAALSGGERAMAASALIFALIRVKPSPFYLLDEVDAALDDANVERFSELVRDVGAQAQLLIVTHNKKTMELASRMYGVTMREPGISSVITADLASVRTTGDDVAFDESPAARASEHVERESAVAR